MSIRHRHSGTLGALLRHDERGSLPMLMLVVLVGMALAALMVPLVITQTHTTTFDTGRGRALQAAESGIDLALGQIRASQSGTGDEGDVAKLPCGPLEGTAGQANASTYSVEIGYYTKNPVGQSDVWLDDNAMACVPGYGVADAAHDVYIPSFVLLTSTGTDGQTGDSRTLTTTYVVHTTDINIPGGQIRLYPSGPVNYCLTVSLPAANGATVTLQPCQDPVPDSQKFAYADQLGIQLVASGDDNPLCLKTEGSSGKPLIMGPCGSENQAPWIEMWGFDNDSHFRVSDPNQKSLSGMCFGASSAPKSDPPYAGVELMSCDGSYDDPVQAWIPSPYVGAGGAGASNGQLVNFFQFGRCLDVTDHDVTSDFLIAYGCMQIPSKQSNTIAGVAPWDQMFVPSPSISEDPADQTPPSQAQWVVTCPSTGDGACTKNSTFCLTAPADVGDYATVEPCKSSDPDQVWTRYQRLDAAGNELHYADKYTIKDDQGRCLSLGSDQQMYHDYYFKVVVQDCDGSTKQKWNARETEQDAGMANLHEK
jgi:hypothetical protein